MKVKGIRNWHAVARNWKEWDTRSEARSPPPPPFWEMGEKKVEKKKKK